MTDRAVKTMTPRRRAVAERRLKGLSAVELVNVLRGLDVSIAETLYDAKAFQAKRMMIYTEMKNREQEGKPNVRRGRQAKRRGQPLNENDLAAAMEMADGCVRTAAVMLGVTAAWVSNRLKAFGLKYMVKKR